MQRVGSTLQQLNITVCAEVDLLEMEGHVLVGYIVCYTDRWCIGLGHLHDHQFCKDLGSSLTYDEGSLSPAIRLLNLPIKLQCQHLFWRPNNIASKLSGACVKHQEKKVYTCA